MPDGRSSHSRSRPPHGARRGEPERASEGMATAVSRSRSARAPNDTAAEAIRKLQAIVDAIEKKRADDRKWLIDNARRIDLLEAQVREQTRESMDHASARSARKSMIAFATWTSALAPSSPLVSQPFAGARD